jgi:LPS-assembly protein
MSRRGLMLGGEFRYLGAASAGRVEGTYLADDDRTGDDRGFFRWQHFSALSPNWYATANLQDVSDREYFRDLGDNFGQNTLSLLDSSLALNGRGRYWSTGVSFERWEAANPAVLPGSEPYARLPRIRGQWLQPVLPWMDLGVSAEAVRFQHDELPGGQRLDVKPSVRLNFGGASWFVNPEFAVRQTSYTLERDPRVMAQRTDLSPDRSTTISSSSIMLPPPLRTHPPCSSCRQRHRCTKKQRTRATGEVRLPCVLQAVGGRQNERTDVRACIAVKQPCCVVVVRLF